MDLRRPDPVLAQVLGLTPEELKRCQGPEELTLTSVAESVSSSLGGIGSYFGYQ